MLWCTMSYCSHDEVSLWGKRKLSFQIISAASLEEVWKWRVHICTAWQGRGSKGHLFTLCSIYSRRDMYLLFLCEFSLQQANLDTTHSVLSQIQTAHKLSLNLNEWCVITANVGNFVQQGAPATPDLVAGFTYQSWIECCSHKSDYYSLQYLISPLSPSNHESLHRHRMRRPRHTFARRFRGTGARGGR